MSREIKFRAWDRITKKMYPIETFHSGVRGSAWVSPNTIDFGGHDNAWDVGDRCDLMQFTGLRDRDGREIYEGDIVKRPVDGNSELHGSYSLSEVIYRNGMWVLSYLRSEREAKIPRGYMACEINEARPGFNKNLFFYDGKEQIDELEVVGTIHQSPELLK